jgi:hypothetical protein
MRMINELIIRGEPPEVSKLVERMEGVPSAHWKREPAIEERLKSMRTAGLGTLCFSWLGGDGKPASSLFLHKRGPGELAVSNIVAVERRSLTDDEYNGILSEFDREILRQTNEGVGVETIVVPPLARFEAELWPETLRQLRAFSTAANRSSLHPLDWERWEKFLIHVYLKEGSLDECDLATWFAEHGWSESQFGPLLERFRVGRSLLSAYDQERSAS